MVYAIAARAGDIAARPGDTVHAIAALREIQCCSHSSTAFHATQKSHSVTHVMHPLAVACSMHGKALP